MAGYGWESTPGDRWRMKIFIYGLGFTTGVTARDNSELHPSSGSTAIRLRGLWPGCNFGD
ncbi:hypothetical protein ACLK2B_03320 [Escherichia coli]